MSHVTRPLGDDFDPHALYNESCGRDGAQHGIGNPRITIDLGKGIGGVVLCAVLCGICAAVTIGTVWHSKERETETQARIRVLQNHIDENTAMLRVMEKANASR